MVEAAECLAAAISSNTDRAYKFARNARQWEDGQGQESWGEGGDIEVGVELKGAPGKRSEKSALGAAEMTKTPKKPQRARARARAGRGGGGQGGKALTSLPGMQRRWERPKWKEHCRTSCCCAKPWWPGWQSSWWCPRSRAECRSAHCHAGTDPAKTAPHQQRGHQILIFLTV